MKRIQQETVAETNAHENDLIAGTSLWHDAWKRLRKNNMALSSGIIMMCLSVACLCGPAILEIMWGYDAHTQNLAYGPQTDHLCIINGEQVKIDGGWGARGSEIIGFWDRK